MPRRGLDRAQVVDAASAAADAEGLEAVTIARVAAELGVRAPSLYNHVDGRPGLLRGIALRGMDELTAILRDAATGRSGRDALTALADAYRADAREHPGRCGRPKPPPVSSVAKPGTGRDVFTSELPS